MSELSWTQKQKPTGKWFVVTGTAYENVVKGKNPTNQVTSNYKNRQAFYHDEAVRLSEADLDKTKGVDGTPICVEHDPDDVVGIVHHSWSGTGDTRAINIIARIDQETNRGKQIVAELKAGKWKGFSIGYAAGLTTNGKTGNTTIDTKEIREISLVEAPFFPNCHVAMGVEASRKMISIAASGRNSATNNEKYLSNDQFEDNINSETEKFFVPITMSQPVEPTLPTTEAQRGAVPGEELLKQADSLKADVNESNRIKEETLKRLLALEEENKRYKAKEQAEQDAYAKSQEPKFQAYVTELEASRKEKLSDFERKKYETIFCSLKCKDSARDLELAMNEKIELRASLKAAQDAAKAESEKVKQLETAVTKTTQVLNHSRQDFAKTVDNNAAAAEDEQRRKINTEVKASLKLNQIVNPHPSVGELPFLQAYGYTSEVNVNASQQDDQYSNKPFVTAVPVAASHKHLIDEERNLMFPDSARYHAPAFFGWMCDNEELRNGDLSDVVNLVASRNEIDRRLVEDWEARHRKSVQGE